MKDCVLLSLLIKILKHKRLIGSKSLNRSRIALKDNATADGQSTLLSLLLQKTTSPGLQMKTTCFKKLLNIVMSVDRNLPLSLKRIRSGGSTGAMFLRD
jgi:hypothetical protein